MYVCTIYFSSWQTKIAIRVVEALLAGSHLQTWGITCVAPQGIAAKRDRGHESLAVWTFRRLCNDVMADSDALPHSIQEGG